MATKRKPVDRPADAEKDVMVFRAKVGEKAAVACGNQIIPLTGPVKITVEKG